MHSEVSYKWNRKYDYNNNNNNSVREVDDEIRFQEMRKSHLSSDWLTELRLIWSQIYSLFSLVDFMNYESLRKSTEVSFEINEKEKGKLNILLQEIKRKLKNELKISNVLISHFIIDCALNYITQQTSSSTSTLINSITNFSYEIAFGLNINKFDMFHIVKDMFIDTCLNRPIINCFIPPSTIPLSANSKITSNYFNYALNLLLCFLFYFIKVNNNDDGINQFINLRTLKKDVEKLGNNVKILDNNINHDNSNGVRKSSIFENEKVCIVLGIAFLSLLKPFIKSQNIMENKNNMMNKYKYNLAIEAIRAFIEISSYFKTMECSVESLENNTPIHNPHKRMKLDSSSSSSSSSASPSCPVSINKICLKGLFIASGSTLNISFCNNDVVETRNIDEVNIKCHWFCHSFDKCMRSTTIDSLLLLAAIQEEEGGGSSTSEEVKCSKKHFFQRISHEYPEDWAKLASIDPDMLKYFTI